MKRFLIAILALVVLSIFLSACSAHVVKEDPLAYLLKEDLCAINHDVASETDPFFKKHFVIYQFDAFGEDTVTIGNCGSDILMPPIPMEKAVDPKNPHKKMDVFDDSHVTILLREMNEYVRGTGHERVIGHIQILVDKLHSSDFEINLAVVTIHSVIPGYTFTKDDMEFLGDGRYLMNRPPKKPDVPWIVVPPVKALPTVPETQEK